jgi:hypothetical protein
MVGPSGDLRYTEFHGHVSHREGRVPSVTEHIFGGATENQPSQPTASVRTHHDDVYPRFATCTWLHRLEAGAAIQQ